MKLADIRNYINAGLTDEQIKAIVTATSAADPEPEQNAKSKNDVTLNDVLQGLRDLTETIQASNITGTKNKEPETIDEILESLIID